MSFYPWIKKDANSMIGLKFKRNKYGLTDWTDTIKAVEFHLEYNVKFKEYCSKCYVVGSLNNNKYDVNEISIVEIKSKIDMDENLKKIHKRLRLEI